MVKEILGDARRRGIEFVTWESLLVPLRSATNGLRMTLEPHSQPRSLLETALHSIFVDRVNWKATESHLREFLLNSLDRDSAARFRVLGFGPGSRSLIDLGMASHPRLDLVENWADSLAQPAADDVAIVGLSVNYPEGKGHEQFWDLLESGRSTLRDVRSPEDNNFPRHFFIHFIILLRLQSDTVVTIRPITILREGTVFPFYAPKAKHQVWKLPTGSVRVRSGLLQYIAS